MIRAAAALALLILLAVAGRADDRPAAAARIAHVDRHQAADTFDIAIAGRRFTGWTERTAEACRVTVTSSRDGAAYLADAHSFVLRIPVAERSVIAVTASAALALGCDANTASLKVAVLDPTAPTDAGNPTFDFRRPVRAISERPPIAQYP